MSDELSVELFSAATAMESMRSSDFDVYSAMGEVMDNSIQAHAQSVKIRIKYSTDSKEPILSVAFGDDGDGMSANLLHRCLQVGYSSRFNDRSGIGRFGVGAILGAINQCKKIDVYSKTDKGRWNYTYLDLDRVTSGEMDSIPIPVEFTPPEEYKGLINEDKGTLVVWTKYDRQPSDATEIIRELNIWIGRTYRKFIWGEVPGFSSISFYINGEEVKAIDPLYVKTEKTRFTGDPGAQKYDTMKLSWPIPEDVQIPEGSYESTILIDMSLLPEQFRPNRGSGSLQSNKDRFIDRNNGISILRNGREVFYGPVPYWPGDRFEEIDRWWGCEISFDAVLDREFTVKNIKRGALPIKELKKAIQEKIRPTRKTCLEKVRDLWSKNRAIENNDNASNMTHSVAENVAKKVKTPANVIDKKKDIDEEIEKYTKQYLGDCDAREKAQLIAKFKSQPFTIIDDVWRGSDFMQVTHLGGKSVLNLNCSHKFFEKLSMIRQELVNGDAENPIASKLNVLIDLLLISFAKAETLTESDDQSLLDSLKTHWGRFLLNYIDDYEKEQEEQNLESP